MGLNHNHSAVDPKRNPWELYDRLIAGIPEDVAALDWSLGNHWSYVESEVGAGLARTARGGFNADKKPEFLGGRQPGDALSLRELAGYAKSWVFEEAALGVGALTSWYNHASITPEIVEADTSINQTLLAAAAGKKATVIGHFPHLEEYGTGCDLTILEREPQAGDVPDSACEYLLTSQDLVIMTGLTLINKTIVRLLELSSRAKVAVAGPSAVCSHILGEYGVDVVGATEVLDVEAIKRIINITPEYRFGDATRRVIFEPKVV
jgi:uncharacterized protein (DUF4213/DUF364 family)